MKNKPKVFKQTLEWVSDGYIKGCTCIHELTFKVSCQVCVRVMVRCLCVAFISYSKRKYFNN